MSLIKELWAYRTGEVAAMGAITIMCGLGIAMIVIALLAPDRSETDEVIEG